MEALCYADKSVTERTDDLSEVLIGDSMDTDSEGKKRTSESIEANMLIYQIDALRKNIYTLRQYQKTAEHKSLCDMITADSENLVTTRMFFFA